ncbi:YceI family protein [Flavihumibacter solisilvae]|uniref:YceI family protein n=1 Tax=Flavihumibacter solisilvae TaxID=1349421 RepID=UPI000B2480E1|nr:YceI family protein [Flavihumibacter solisilvae]
MFLQHLSQQSGVFNDFDVTVNTTKPDFSDAVFELKAKVASIDTRVEARDKHLKSADFFDAEKFPVMHFASTAIQKAGKNKYKLTGALTLRGITKQVTMNLEYKGNAENPVNKKPTVGFQLTGSIRRSDFNIGNNFPSSMISDEVHIKADGEFVQ